MNAVPRRANTACRLVSAINVLSVSVTAVCPTTSRAHYAPSHIATNALQNFQRASLGTSVKGGV